MHLLAATMLHAVTWFGGVPYKTCGFFPCLYRRHRRVIQGVQAVNDQERQIISDIFQRLEQTSGQARDAEAERLIADKVRAQPYAPYAMAQALYVQEEAMKSLNEQLQQLKAENAQLHQQGGQGSGSFLSSIFGGGQRPQQPAPNAGFARPGSQQGYAPQPSAPPQGGPWGGSAPAQGYQGGYPAGAAPGGYAAPQQSSGGGFLTGALTTAAGVAGGMVVGNALMNAFSGGHHALGGFSNNDLASMGGGETVVENNYFGSPDQGGMGNAGMDQSGFSGDDSAGLQDASFDDGGADFGGGDMGGDDDSSWT